MPKTYTSKQKNSTLNPTEIEQTVYQLAFSGDKDAVNSYLESDPETYVPHASKGYAGSKRIEELLEIVYNKNYKNFLIPDEIYFVLKLAGLHDFSEIYYMNLPPEVQNSFDPNPLRARGLAANKAYDLLDEFTQRSNSIYIMDTLHGLAFNNDLPHLEHYQKVYGANPYAIASALASYGHEESAVDYQEKEKLDPVFIAQILEEQCLPGTAPYYEDLLYHVRGEVIRKLLNNTQYDQAQAYYQVQNHFFKNTFYPRLLAIHEEADPRFQDIRTTIMDYISKRQFHELEHYSKGIKEPYLTMIPCELAKERRYAEIGTYQDRGANVQVIARAFESINNPVFAAYYYEKAQKNQTLQATANTDGAAFTPPFFSYSASQIMFFKQLEIKEGIELRKDLESTKYPVSLESN